MIVLPVPDLRRDKVDHKYTVNYNRVLWEAIQKEKEVHIFFEAPHPLIDHRPELQMTKAQVRGAMYVLPAYIHYVDTANTLTEPGKYKMIFLSKGDDAIHGWIEEVL